MGKERSPELKFHVFATFIHHCITHVKSFLDQGKIDGADAMLDVMDDRCMTETLSLTVEDPDIDFSVLGDLDKIEEEQ